MRRASRMVAASGEYEVMTADDKAVVVIASGSGR